MLSYPPKNSSLNLTRERQSELLMVAETFIWNPPSMTTTVNYLSQEITYCGNNVLEAEKLDYNQMARVVTGLVHTIRKLAEG